MEVYNIDIDLFQFLWFVYLSHLQKNKGTQMILLFEQIRILFLSGMKETG